jgi:endonuclease/exonuclease/phosphatase family metal-dependent hydrolase
MRSATAALVGLLLGIGAGSAGCTDSTDDATDPQPRPSASAELASPNGMPLSLLVFNVEYGGSKATDQVMADIDADVVGVLESYDRLPEIAARTGYPYYNVGLQLLSKYPILEPSGGDGRYAFLEVRPGEAVAMINTHLDYVQDGPNRLERGVPLAAVLAAEREVRLSSVKKLLPAATRLLDRGWPLLFTGDLNEPSHLDWTRATAAQHGGLGPVRWPVSEALVEAGLRDTYRETHPDPVADPGTTWGQVAGSGGSPRRIDYAYVGGPVEVASAEVVGEQGADGVDRGYPRWTSDHRAVLAQLAIAPVPLPTLVALSSRLLTIGDAVTVTYRLPPGDSSGTVELDGPSTASYEVSGQAGTVAVDTASLAAGAYRVDLGDQDGSVVASNDLYLRSQAARVDLTTDAETYDVGDPITVSWTDGPANRWDWIGIYRAEAADPDTDDYLVWGYTGGHDAGALPPTTDGELVLGREHQGRPWPLPPGRYAAHYLLTDQHVSAGSTSFTVQ